MILMRAKVTTVTEAGEIFVEAPDLGVGQDFGPCEVSSGTFEVGDRVLVGQIEVMEDLVIVAKLNARTTDDPGGGGGILAFYSETEPFANGIGDLWINAGNSNILNWWDGEAWLPVRDEGIQAALDVAAAAQTAAGNALSAAGTAQTTANNALALAGTKNHVYHQDAAPGPTGLVEGDLWIESDNGNRLHRWFNNGATYEWFPVLLGGQAIELGSIGKEQLDPSLDVGSDGDPPAEAPVVAAEPFPGGVSLRWARITNNDPVTYEVHAASTTGFIWGPATLVMETDGSSVAVHDINGAPLSTVSPTYFVVVPKDEDGYGPASTEISETARKLTQTEIDDAFADYLDGIQQAAQDAQQDAQDAANAAAAAQTDATAALADALEAQNAADAAITTFYASTAPAGMNDTTDLGNLWYNDTTGKVSVWRGSTNGGWVAVTDQQIIDAIDAAQNAQDTADAKIQTFWRDSEPTNPADNLGSGDIWFDTDDDNHPHRWSGSAWVSVRDAQIAAAADAAADAFTAATNAMDAAIAAQATADGAIRTYYASDPPWANGSTQPPEVVGDMWFDLDNGQAYRWNGAQWQVITDNAIATALQAAQDAQTTADGKITAWYQTNLTVPATAGEGDILFRTDLQNRLYRLTGSPLAWQPLQSQSNDEITDTIGNLINDIDAIEITANGKNRIYWSDTAPSAGAFVDGDVWFQRAVGTEQITKMWQYDSSVPTWVEQELADAMFANLDVLGHLQTQSIGAEFLLIGDFTNHAVNPSFEYGDGFAGWNGKNSFTNIDTTTKRTGDQSMRFTGNATLKTNNAMSVEPGDEILFTVWYRTSSDVTPASCRFAAFDQNNVERNLDWSVLSAPDFGALPSLTFVRAAATFVVPATGVYEITPGFVNVDNGQTVWVDDVTVRRKGTGELIVDGTVLASALQADSITGDQINTEWLDALTVKANNIEAGYLTSDIGLTAKFTIQSVTQDVDGNLVPDLDSNQIQMDAVNGLQFRVPTGDFEADGVTPIYNEILSLPLSTSLPAVWKGAVKTDKVTTQSLDMTGDAHATEPVYSTVATGAKLRLDNTIENPTALDKPDVFFGAKKSTWPASHTFQEIGMGHHNGLLVQGKLTETQTAGVYRIRGRYVSPTTGALDHDDSNSWPFYSVAGFTCTGGYYYVLHKFTKGTDPWTISRFSRTWAIDGPSINVNSLMGGGYNTGCLGDAGRDDCVAFAYRDDNDEIHIRYYNLNLAAHATLQNQNATSTNTGRSMVGVPDVDVVAAGNRFFWLKGGTYDASKSWNTDSAMSTAAYFNGEFISTSGNAEKETYNNDIVDDTTVLYAAYTKRVYHMDAFTYVIDKETTIGGVLQTAWPTRMFARLVAPDLVAGTNDTGLYASTTGDARTDLRNVVKLPGNPNAVISKAPVSPAANPPLTSTFNGGSSFPGAIETKITIPGTADKAAIGIYGDGTAVLYGLKQPSAKRRSTVAGSIGSGVSSSRVIVDFNIGQGITGSDTWEREIVWSQTNKNFTILQAGRYRISAQYGWQSIAGGGYRGLTIIVNGVDVDRGLEMAPPNFMSLSKYDGEIMCGLNDTVAIGLYQNSGSSIDLRTVAEENYVVISRVALT